MGLIVLIGVLLLVAILTPAVLDRVEGARRTQAIANGRDIVSDIVAAEFAAPYAPPGESVAMPRDESTTSEFLTRMVSEGHLQDDPRQFAAHGVSPAETPVSADRPLRSQNNAWRIVVGHDVHTDPPNLPMLITRNLTQSTLADPPQLSDQPPFGLKGAVVVSLSGAARSIEADALEDEWRRLTGPAPPPHPILPP